MSNFMVQFPAWSGVNVRIRPSVSSLSATRNSPLGGIRYQLACNELPQTPSRLAVPSTSIESDSFAVCGAVNMATGSVLSTCIVKVTGSESSNASSRK
ncbi:MAG: Uncharacterised protein [Methanobacteriota archaeon]|nr:MAG: Uncharacterised protein [Euryarchaeota archaeon]